MNLRIMEFNSLPPEVHLEVFSYLPVRHVMSIRRVCKLWNGLINAEVKFKRLRYYQGFLEEQIFNPYDFYFTSVRSFLDHVSADPKFRVRCLEAHLISKASELQDAFDFLNSFKSLKKASFECIIRDRLNVVVRTQFVVSLQHLEEVNFRFIYSLERPKVLLDLPSLLCLSTDSLTEITLSHPEKLRTLATNSLFRAGQDYSLFTSLTDIFTATDVASISASFLKELPSLKELHFAYGYSHSFSPACSYLPANYRLPQPSLDKAEPKIFIFGFQVSVREIESEGRKWQHAFGYNSKVPAPFIARYLHRSVQNNSYILSIDYNPISRQLNDAELFGVIPQKFSSINHLLISGTVADQNRLLKFIDKLKVRSVAFESASLPAPFFAKFVKNCPLISSLEISDRTMSILSGDLDFIFNLKKLVSLRFEDCQLSLNFMARTLRELKWISEVTVDRPVNYDFSLRIVRSPQKIVSLKVKLHVPRTACFEYQVPIEEAPNFLNALHNHLNVDGAVCVKELQILLRHLKFENENALFWIRKYLYDQRHSICVSEELMRQLNLYR